MTAANCFWCGDEDSSSLCPDCAQQVDRMQVRHKESPAPFKLIELAVLVGFNHMPSQDDICNLGAVDPEICGTHLATLMLSGGLPQDPVETKFLAARTAKKKSVQILGHPVNIGRVTYETFNDMLVLKLWM